MTKHLNPNRVIYIFRILLANKRDVLEIEKAELNASLSGRTAAGGQTAQRLLGRIKEIDKVLAQINVAFKTINEGAYRYYAGVV